jgi:hypothetical protein
MKTFVTAIVEFSDFGTTINNFESIRKGFITIPKARAVLTFYSSETNSFNSLFTRDLQKPAGKSDK